MKEAENRAKAGKEEEGKERKVWCRISVTRGVLSLMLRSDSRNIWRNCYSQQKLAS